jgi:DNA-binding response OmpR family regulator
LILDINLPDGSGYDYIQWIREQESGKTHIQCLILTANDMEMDEVMALSLGADDYMSKPFKYPVKNQAWRLMNSGSVSQGAATKYVEIITNTWDTIGAYNIRYVRVPRPIIVAELGDLSIDNESHQSTECEIDPILHEDILQRAVELAKVAWTSTGQDNMQAVMQAGTRSE